MARIIKKKASFGTSMGVSSIIAILVILVLVVFSALSITTSKADLRLSQKTSASVKAYYEADAAAEDKFAEISAIFGQGSDWEKKLAAEGCAVSQTASGTVIAYTVPIDENRNLNIELTADSNRKLTRTLWQVVPANEWSPDNNLNLFRPGM